MILTGTQHSMEFYVVMHVCCLLLLRILQLSTHTVSYSRIDSTIDDISEVKHDNHDDLDDR